jgi:hypothetical protein
MKKARCRRDKEARTIERRGSVLHGPSPGDVILNNLKSEPRNLELLIDYAKRLGNGAVFKRLGFLLELLAREEEEALRACLSGLPKGNAKLDSALPAERLISKRRLWVPENLMKKGTKQ